MIITCPQCETRYTADAGSFPASGRKVRCSKCGHVWQQAAPEVERVLAPEQTLASPAADTLAPPPSFLAMRAAVVPHAKAATAAPRRSWAERLGLIAGWMGLAAVLVLIGWMGLRFRHEIQALWPQSSAIYATFGIKVNSGGIELNDVTYRHESENGQAVFEVSAKLVNVSAHEESLPRVQVALTDDEQNELYLRTYNPPLRTLGVGQSVGFLMKMRDTPPAARQLQLHFASKD